MARSRNIKPGFFKNETLAECSPLARLLFAGLWCLADREGLLEDRPKRIRAEVLPYDDGSVDAMLDELHKAGFILRYQHGEQRFIQVVNFTKHQTPHHREPASTIPGPDVEEDETGLAQVLPTSSPGLVQVLPMPSRADSLNLIPDSLNPEVPSSTGADAPPAKLESSDPIFGHCLEFMTAKGCAVKGARSFLGLMRKNYGDASLMQAVERAEREDISDPIPWIRKYLEGRPKESPAAKTEPAWMEGLL